MTIFRHRTVHQPREVFSIKLPAITMKLYIFLIILEIKMHAWKQIIGYTVDNIKWSSETLFPGVSEAFNGEIESMDAEHVHAISC